MKTFRKIVNFCCIFFAQGIKIQNGGKMKHSFVRYIGCVHKASQKIRQIQAYHRKTYCDFTIQRVIRIVLFEFL